MSSGALKVLAFMFIPKHLQHWTPTHHTHRRCHWCCKGPVRVGELITVMEAPMRWHFCAEACVHAWQERRHDADALEWLKHGVGDRAKVLAEALDETPESTSACHRSFARLCSGTRLALSMPEGAQLP